MSTTPSALAALGQAADAAVAQFTTDQANVVQDQTKLTTDQLAAATDGQNAAVAVQALINAATAELASLPPVPTTGSATGSAPAVKTT